MDVYLMADGGGFDRDDVRSGFGLSMLMVWGIDRDDDRSALVKY